MLEMGLRGREGGEKEQGKGERDSLLFSLKQDTFVNVRNRRLNKWNKLYNSLSTMMDLALINKTDTNC